MKTKKCKVVFDYRPENDDELELVVGHSIDFIREVCLMRVMMKMMTIMMMI